MDTPDKVELFRRARCLVRRINRRSINEMKEKYGGEISHAEFRVILFAGREEGISFGALAQMWSMYMSNITKLVNSLVDKGYAVKKVSDADKRVKLLYLTEEGERIKGEYIKEFEGRVNKCLGKVDNEIISDALEAINAILDQM